MTEPTETDIVRLLRQSQRIAVVGLSPDPYRASLSVSRYLQGAGYEIIPVNPNYTEVLGQRCYPSLRDVPGKVDLVDVFRNPRFLLPVVEDAIAITAPALWLQLGVINQEAITRATAAGLEVVVDRCIKIEHSRYRAAIAAPDASQ